MEKEKEWNRQGELVCRQVLEGQGSQVDFFYARGWWLHNAACVAASGQCVRGCRPEHLIEIGAMECNRAVVCVHTGEPCKGQRLSYLLDLYSRLNNRGKGHDRDEGIDTHGGIDGDIAESKV